MPLSSVVGAQSIIKPGVCTSSTRPASPYDGQVIYETDTDKIAVYDASAWVYKTPATSVGSVVQVVSTTKTDTFSTASSSFTDITGLSASITPKSISNKILVTAHVTAGCNGNSSYFKVLRGATDISVGDAASNRARISFWAPPTSSYEAVTVSFTYLDSPSTTSSTVYKIQGRSNAGATMYINRGEGDRDTTAYDARATSSITLTEIAG